MITKNEYYITNAPASYDYNYVETVGKVISKTGKEHRVLRVYDFPRFRDFQMPRYSSGLFQAFTVDSEEARYRFEEETLKSFLEGAAVS